MIPEFFRRLAAVPSSAVAVHAARECIGYGALLEQVEARAARMDAEGVRVLGSRLDNGREWIVTDLAALRAAVVHVPIPAFFTEGQHRHVMAATGADALIASCPGGVQLQRYPSRPLLMPQGTSKVTFTSGTSGEPKGVCLSAEAQLGVASGLVAATSGLGIERHLCALLNRDLLQTPVISQSRDVPWQVVASNHVEDDIRPTDRSHHVNEITLTVIDRLFGAEIEAMLALFIRSCGCKHPRTESARQLDRGGSDAGRSAVDEELFARFQTRAQENVRPDSEVGLGQRCGFLHTQTLGQRQGMRRRTQRIFGISSPRQQSADQIADAPIRHARPHG